MNKAQMQDQIAPGSVGLALATIWMTYGESAHLVPADLSEVKYAALTAAIGVVCTALVNVIRRFTTKTQGSIINQVFEVDTPEASQFDAGRRLQEKEENQT